MKAQPFSEHLANELYLSIDECERAGNDKDRLATLLNNLAVLHHRNERYPEAIYAFNRAGAIWAQEGEHAKCALALNNRASVCRDIEEYPEAEKVFQEALEIWRKYGWPDAGEVLANDDSSFQTGGLRQHPIWDEQPDFGGGHLLRNYAGKVRRLRNAFESGDRKARHDLEETLRKLGPWYHNVDLGGGVTTDPQLGDYPGYRWRVLEPFVSPGLQGQTVLDIGCNSGFFSVQMARRGAGRIVGIDIMPHVLAQARFLSHWFETYQELYELGVYDVERLETTFDHIIFVGVLYHLKHPLYALEKVANVCGGRLYFQSCVRGPVEDFQPASDYPITERNVFERPGYPKLYFIEKSFNGDESNWWFATRSCLKAMLRVSGFSGIRDTSDSETFVCTRP
jgi:tRNA (mo5U34)-methyltransferase